MHNHLHGREEAKPEQQREPRKLASSPTRLLVQNRASPANQTTEVTHLGQDGHEVGGGVIHLHHLHLLVLPPRGGPSASVPAMRMTPAMGMVRGLEKGEASRGETRLGPPQERRSLCGDGWMRWRVSRGSTGGGQGLGSVPCLCTLAQSTRPEISERRATVTGRAIEIAKSDGSLSLTRWDAHHSTHARTHARTGSDTKAPRESRRAGPR